MKSTILTAGLIGLVSGVAGAFVATTLVQSPPPPPPVAAAPGATLEALGADLRDLTQSVGQLGERLESLEIQSRLVADRREVARSDEALARAESEESQAEKLAAALTASGSDLPPEFQKTVKNALQEIREQEVQERADRRREAYELRLDERLAELALEIGLNRNQQDDLRNLFLDTDARRNEMFAAMRDGNGDWGSARDQMREMRDGIEQSLAKVLSPDQLEKFKDSDASRMLLGFGGGPGGGPGGGGGGNNNRRNRNNPPAGG